MATVTTTMKGRHAELYRAIKAGTEDLSDWDVEELTRGYRRSKSGQFTGRPPAAVPREVHDELARRVKTQVAHELRGVVAVHVAPVLREILTGSLSPEDVPALRLKAQVAQDLIDRFVIGKAEEVHITGTMKHEAVIADVTIQRDIPDEDGIIDLNEVQEDDEDDWDDVEE